MAARSQLSKSVVSGVPDFKALVGETDELIKKQRQKGIEYKFREGPGRPQVQLEGDVAVSAAPASQSAGKDENTKMGNTVAAQASVNLDSYDPLEQAIKEQKALVDSVSKMRSEASHLFSEVGSLTRKFDTLKATLEQLAYEDDVDNERRQGLNKMREMKARLHYLTLSLDDAEHYSRVLGQVIKRLSEEKLSKLSTMKAFEDALRVQRHELELVQDVQRSAVKSRDEEMTELVRLQSEVRKQIQSLDRKLEGRRMEVKVRQEKAKWRLAKLQEELSLKAQAEGDLTEEEERAMIAKAQNLSQEAAELRAERVRAQAEADDAEKEYTHIRVAAGVAIGSECIMESPRGGSAGGDGGFATATGGSHEGDEEGVLGSYIAPDGQPIIHRFNTLEDEMRHVEDQLQDYTNRLNTLQQQLSLLRGLAEPRAKDGHDEEDRDIGVLQALRERITTARRALDSAKEAEAFKNLRIQLEQSVTVLMERMESIPPPIMGGKMASKSLRMSPEEAEVTALAFASLDEIQATHPSAWSKTLHERILTATRALHSLMRVLDPLAAASAMSKAQMALARALSGQERETADAFGPTSPAPHAIAITDAAAADGASSAAGDTDLLSDLSAGAAAAAASAAAGAEVAEAMEVDRRMDATIETLLVRNEWSIRVRPSSVSGASRPTKAISGRALAEAVQAFERTWKDVSNGVVPGAQGQTTFSASEYLPEERATSDAYSKEASRQRRRNSRIELETAYASAAVAAVGAHTPVVEDPSDADEGSGKGGKKKNDTAGRPKTKDISRFLATAAAMAGDEVDDAMWLAANQVQSKKDADDVLTRDKLKRNVKVAQAAQQQQMAAAALLKK